MKRIPHLGRAPVREGQIREKLLHTQIQRRHKPRQRSPNPVCFVTFVHALCYIARNQAVSCLQCPPALPFAFFFDAIIIRVNHQRAILTQATAAPPTCGACTKCHPGPLKLVLRCISAASKLQEKKKCYISACAHRKPDPMRPSILR